MTAASQPPGEVWLDDRIDVARSVIDGKGLFAVAGIAAGETVLRLGGSLVSSSALDELMAAAEADPAAPCVDTITIYEDAHLVLPSGTNVHFANHSCDPNAWHVGPYELAARRHIRAGEEVTIDYGTQSGAEGFVMTCRCGSPLCRGEISSDDWRRPELQRRYGGHWTPALQQRIHSA